MIVSRAKTDSKTGMKVKYLSCLGLISWERSALSAAILNNLNFLFVTFCWAAPEEQEAATRDEIYLQMLSKEEILLRTRFQFELELGENRADS